MHTGERLIAVRYQSTASAVPTCPKSKNSCLLLLPRAAAGLGPDAVLCPCCCFLPMLSLAGPLFSFPLCMYRRGGWQPLTSRPTEGPVLLYRHPRLLNCCFAASMLQSYLYNSFEQRVL
jgi:hypothetical protein